MLSTVRHDCRQLVTVTPEDFARGALADGLPSSLRSDDSIKAALSRGWKVDKGGLAGKALRCDIGGAGMQATGQP